MKLENERLSKTGNEEKIGVFAMGVEEAQLIHDMAEHLLQHTPKTIGTDIVRNRARTISKELAKWLLTPPSPDVPKKGK